MSKTCKKISNRFRSKKDKKEIFSNLNRKARQNEIEKIKEKALTTLDLNNLLNHTENFLGVFASDEIEKIRILNFPAFLISNLDIKTLPGSHWICLRIDKFSIEIFDSLGFDQKLWGKFPSGLQKFLGRYQFTHKFHISPVFQPESTQDCGFYCVFFVLYRALFSFNDCVSMFSRVLTHNHKILINKLKSF